MKPRFIMLLLTTIALFTGSCKKCGNCVTTITTTAPGIAPQTSTSTHEECGDELKEADGNISTSTATNGSVTATSTSRTECD